MAFVEDDQANIVDQRWVASQSKVEFFGRRNDDLTSAQGIFITDGKAAGTIERGDTKPEGCKRLPEGPFGLSRQGA